MTESPPVIAAIAAISSNGMLGHAGGLPWDIPEDVTYFENIIRGAALVVGRLTLQTMPYVPVDTFVVSGRADLVLPAGCHCCRTVEAALQAAQATGKPVFVIGGAGIYEAAWPYCKYFYLTRILRDFPGNVALPASIPFANWSLIREEERQLREQTSGENVICRFQIYQQQVPRQLG
jgi:dihydrofolate reductase